MTARPEGWWWPPAVGKPRKVTRVHGVEIPSLEDGVDELVAHLRSSGKGLAARSSVDIAETLGAVGQRIQGDLADASAAAVSVESGLSLPMAKRVVDGMASGWTKTALTSLVRSEFVEGAVLDGFVDAPTEDVPGRRLRAFGRGFTVHIGSGSVPGVSVSSLIRALIVKCPSLVKPGFGDVGLTVAFLRALYEEDASLADSAAALYWPGGSGEAASVEEALFQGAEQVVVYGNDETVDRVRVRTPASTPLIVHPHRIGVVVAGRGAENDAVAEAICLFDQRGCVSPQVLLYLGDETEAAEWAESLGGELSRLEEQLPPGRGSDEALSAVHQLRGTLELRQAAGEPIRTVYREGESWSLIVAPLEEVRPIGMRTAWIVATPRASVLEGALRALSPVLQSVGLTGVLDSADLVSADLVSADLVSSDLGVAGFGVGQIVDAATSAGASRVVPVRSLPFPEAGWLHDGQGPLRELVRWAESH